MPDIPRLPLYARTKIVEAARITGWTEKATGGRYLLALDHGGMIEVTSRFMRRYHVCIGMYVVKDEGPLRCVTEEHFRAWYKPVVQGVPELEDMPSMRPQVDLLRARPKAKVAHPVASGIMDLVLARTAREDGE